MALLPVALLLFSCGCSPPSPFEHEFGSVVAALDSEAEIPSGMRRTSRGWEDASLWHISPDIENRSIDDWMETQQDREPGWLRTIFAEIRMTPPLMIAVIQITAIAAIVHIGHVQKTKRSEKPGRSITIDNS